MRKRRADEDDGAEWGVEALPRRLVERPHPIWGGWTVVLTRSETKSSVGRKETARDRRRCAMKNATPVL
jgi:hypothetical protein